MILDELYILCKLILLLTCTPFHYITFPVLVINTFTFTPILHSRLYYVSGYNFTFTKNWQVILGIYLNTSRFIRFICFQLTAWFLLLNSIISLKTWTMCFPIQHNILKIFTLNVRSPRAYFNELLLLLNEADVNYDIIVLTETWLTQDEINRYNLPGYILRSDCRSHKRSRGVLIYINENVIISDININFTSGNIVDI